MIKNWGVIGGIAAAIAAGVYVLWGPITERKKRKRGKSCCDRVAHTLYLWHCLHCSKLQWLVVPCRYGTRSFKLGEHLLSELVTSGLSSMSVIHQVAGEVCSSAFNPVLQRQPAIHDTAPASQRYIKPVSYKHSVLDMLSSSEMFTWRLFLHWQRYPVKSQVRMMFLMLDVSWMSSDCTDGTSAHLKSRSVGIIADIVFISNE